MAILTMYQKRTAGRVGTQRYAVQIHCKAKTLTSFVVLHPIPVPGPVAPPVVLLPFLPL